MITYGNTAAKRAGIKKEVLHKPIITELFKPVNIIIIASSYKENTEEKIDYWGVVNNIKLHPFDFKSCDYPSQRFCLTYKINNSYLNEFEVGPKNIMYIFLLEHKYEYAFVKKLDVFNWFNQYKPKLYPGKYDNSNYFEFPTNEIEKLAKIKSYKNCKEYLNLLNEGSN